MPAPSSATTKAWVIAIDAEGSHLPMSKYRAKGARRLAAGVPVLVLARLFVFVVQSFVHAHQFLDGVSEARLDQGSAEQSL